MNMNLNEKIIFFGAGCGIGLLLGALFAPQSGEQTRQTISNKVDDIAHKVQEKIQSSGIRETAAQTWQSAVERGKSVANMGKQRLNDTMEAGRRRFNETMDDVAER